MAKMKLSEGGFSIVPEGVTVFKVMEVDDSKYEDFGKLNVKLQTANGQTLIKYFSFIKANGELNEGAHKDWSYFVRTCLNNFNADEIDTQDIVGCYIQATVKHEKYTRTKGEHAGEEGTAARITDYTVASGFGGSKSKANDQADDDDDLDSFLDD